MIRKRKNIIVSAIIIALLLFFYLKNNLSAFLYKGYNHAQLNENEYVIDGKVYSDLLVSDAILSIECNYIRDFLLQSKDTVFFDDNYHQILFYKNDKEYLFEIFGYELDSLRFQYINSYASKISKYLAQRRIQKIKLNIVFPTSINEVGVLPPYKHYGNTKPGVLPVCKNSIP